MSCFHFLFVLSQSSWELLSRLFFSGQLLKRLFFSGQLLKRLFRCKIIHQQRKQQNVNRKVERHTEVRIVGQKERERERERERDTVSSLMRLSCVSELFS